MVDTVAAAGALTSEVVAAVIPAVALVLPTPAVAVAAEARSLRPACSTPARYPESTPETEWFQSSQTLTLSFTIIPAPARFPATSRARALYSPSPEPGRLFSP